MSDEWGRQPKKDFRGKKCRRARVDSARKEGSDGSRKGWMLKFSTMKVGPPKGAKPATNQTNMGKNSLGQETGQLTQGGPSGQCERKPRGDLNNFVSDLTILHILADT